VLLAADDTAGDRGLLNSLLDGRLDATHDLATIAARLADGLLDDPVAHRIERGEAEILELQPDGIHAEPVGDRDEDVEGFACDAPALAGRHHRQCAHVVEPVGELDENHADVADHRHHHLAEVFRLRLIRVVELHLGQFADPVDHLGDLFAEIGRELLLGGAGVLDDIVQQGGRDAARIHVHLGEDVSDRDRVADVRFAAATELPGMRLRTKQIGTMNVVDLGRLEIGLEQVAEVTELKQCRQVVRGWRLAVGLAVFDARCMRRHHAGWLSLARTLARQACLSAGESVGAATSSELWAAIVDSAAAVISSSLKKESSACSMAVVS